MLEKVLDICTDALTEINAYGPSDPPISAGDGALCLRLLNQEVDAWAARKVYAYNVNFQPFTLTPNHGPHLIGPGLAAPDFAAAQRPVRIEGATLILNTVTPAVDVPLVLRDDDWWRNQRVKGLKSNVPTDLFYSPDWPNGALNFWPVPNFAYGARLELWGLISQFASLNDPVSLPPAYRKALRLTMALRYCRPFGRPIPDGLKEDAAEARYDVQRNNIKSPRIGTADIGTGGGRRSGFNYYSGS